MSKKDSFDDDDVATPDPDPSRLPYSDGALWRTAAAIAARQCTSQAARLACAREVLRTKRLVKPVILRKVLKERADEIARLRCERATARRHPRDVPMLQRWPRTRLEAIREHVKAAVHEHYKGPTSQFGGWEIDVVTSTQVGAVGARRAGYLTPYRPGRRSYPDFHDWVWTLTLRETWLADVRRRLGTCVVDGALILDVLSDEEGVDGRRLNVLWLRQRRGNSINAERAIVYRAEPGYPWWLRTGGAITPAWVRRRKLGIAADIMTT